jgi:hypothetical protein
VKGPQIVLGIAVLGSITSAVGSVVVDGPRAALSPMVTAVVFGLVLYKVVRNPPAPTRWTRPRVLATAAIYATSSLAMLITLAWVLTVRPEWPIRIVAVLGILLVPTLGVWLVRVARAQDRDAQPSGRS